MTALDTIAPAEVRLVAGTATAPSATWAILTMWATVRF
jgi:hypothetical protein